MEEVTDESLIEEVFKRGLCRVIEHRVFLDGLIVRSSNLTDEEHGRIAQAQAVRLIAQHLVEQGLISQEIEDPGPDFSPGSRRYVARLGVLT